MSRMPAAVERRGARDRSALIAAYREGLGLAAVVVTCGPAGIRVSAVGQRTGGVPDAAAVEVRWWCHYFGRFTHAAACCKSIFGNAGNAALVAGR